MTFFNIEEEMMAFANEEAILDGYYIEYEIAIEEDTNSDTTVDDETKKQNIGQIFLEKCQKLIKEIIAIIDRLVSKLKNVMGRVLTTDEGFKKQIREAIKKNKPLEGVKLITYQYNEPELDRIENKVSETVFKLISSLKTSYADEMDDSNKHPLDMSKNDLYNYIFNKVGCPNDVTDLNLFYEYMKKTYRKDKKETLYLSSNTRVYYNITMSYSKLQTIVNGKNTLMRQQVSILRTNLSNITKNTQTPDSLKKRAMRQVTNASLLYNFYSSVLSMYIELKIERILSYRIVLKRLYRI